MNFIEKLRDKPERIRKFILLVVVIVVALILGSWWIYSSYWKINNFKKEEFIKELELPKFAP